jgi:hypothetical protein
MDYLSDDGFVRNITWRGECAPPLSLDCLNHLVQLGGAWQVVHRDVESVIGEPERDAAAYSARGTRDQGDALMRLGWRLFTLRHRGMLGVCERERTLWLPPYFEWLDGIQISGVISTDYHGKFL